MKKVLVISLLAVILLSVSFTSISALSPETDLKLMDKIKSLEKKLNDKIKSLEKKINDLLAENTKLKTENTKLKEHISKLETKPPKIITYSIKSAPDYADHLIIEKAVKTAFARWDESNSQINYVRVDSGGNIYVNYTKTVGNVKDNQVLGFVNEVGCVDNCVITLALGTLNCNGQWSQFTSVSTQEITMHEIGHTLGLTHTKNNSKLMYSEVDPFTSSKYENLGYVIPTSVIDKPITLETEKQIEKIQKSRNKINESAKEFGLTFDDIISGKKTSALPEFDNVVPELIEYHNRIMNEMNCIKTYESVD